MKKSSSSKSIIDTGIYRTPIELAIRADNLGTYLIARYGKIQALKITEMLYNNMQDHSIKSEEKIFNKEEKIFDEEKKRRVDSLAKEFKRMQGELKRLEEVQDAG